MKSIARATGARRILFCWLWVPLLIGVAQTAQDHSESSSAATREAPTPIDADTLEAFLDPLVARCLDRFHVPGVVVVVVHEAQTVIAKGYGYADFEKMTPVDPDKTLFRVASVSKPFTATAIMQLAERGSINLQDHVTTHVFRLRIRRSYSEPVTIAQLLTHTAGFDNSDIGDSARTPSEMMSLEQFLAARMIAQVFPPGTLKHYSNHGYALAGYVLEVVSGVPFDTYMDENILRPLGMQHSSFARVLPEPLQGDLAVGYEGNGASFDPLPPEYSNMVPADGLKTSGADMARFMIAHLHGGQYRQARILSEASIREMHRQQFRTMHGYRARRTDSPRILWEANGYFARRAARPGFHLKSFSCLTGGWVCLSPATRAALDSLEKWSPVSWSALSPLPKLRYTQHYKKVIMVRWAVLSERIARPDMRGRRSRR